LFNLNKHFSCLIVFILNFRSNSKASKNKSKKLLNLLTKPIQKAVHIIKSKEDNLENVIESQPNKFEDSADEEGDSTEVKGIILFK